MCKKPKSPKVEKVEMPSAPASPPPAEPVAEAPVIASESATRTRERNAKKKGTSGLRIDLATGGEQPRANGLSIPV